MFDERGKPVTEAGPSTPVKVLGLHDVPLAGDTFYVVKDEKAARAEVEERRRAHDEALLREAHPVNLDSLFGEISAGNVKELNIILKTDVQGSIDPIRHSLERLSNEESAREDHPLRLRHHHRVGRHARRRFEGHHHRLQLQA